jgi:hypothetical protein
VSGVVNVVNHQGEGHSLAFDSGEFLDPNGVIMGLDEFAARYVVTNLWVVK